MKQNRFSEFPENNRIPEGLSNIFEDSSQKCSSGKLSGFSIFWVCPPILDIYSQSLLISYVTSTYL